MLGSVFGLGLGLDLGLGSGLGLGLGSVQCVILFDNNFKTEKNKSRLILWGLILRNSR